MGKVRLGRAIRILWLACYCALAGFFPIREGRAGQANNGEYISIEYRVKAAFLLNFARFADWPKPADASSSPLVICVLGNDPFGKSLTETVAGETVDSRPVEVRRTAPSSTSNCDITFSSDPEASPPQPRPGLLTVGEGPAFLRKGGAIAFVVESRRVRFDINQKAVSLAGIKVSSRLMRVARSVER
jgi:uncharacterized protein DUF4154